MFFKKKDIYQKINSWAEKGHLGKLMNEAAYNEDDNVRIAAYTAMGTLRAKESVEALLGCFKKDEVDSVKIAAAKALEKICTKVEFESISHFAENETSPEVKEALKAAAVQAKERGVRW